MWIKIECSFDVDPRVVRLSCIGRAVLQYLWRRTKESHRAGQLSADFFDAEYLAGTLGTKPEQQAELVEQVDKVLKLGFFSETERGTYRAENWSRFQVDNTATERQRARRQRVAEDGTKYSDGDFNRDIRDVTEITGTENTESTEYSPKPVRYSENSAGGVGRPGDADRLGGSFEPRQARVSSAPPPASQSAAPPLLPLLSVQEPPAPAFIPASDREQAIFAALERARFFVPGRGDVRAGEVVKDLGRLVRALSGPAYANVAPTAIDHAANWTQTNHPKAKAHVDRFLVNWFAKEHEAIGRRLPSAPSGGPARPKRDLEAVVQERVYQTGGAK